MSFCPTVLWPFMDAQGKKQDRERHACSLQPAEVADILTSELCLDEPPRVLWVPAGGTGVTVKLTAQRGAMANSRGEREGHMAVSCVPVLMGGRCAPNTNEVAAGAVS